MSEGAHCICLSLLCLLYLVTDSSQAPFLEYTKESPATSHSVTVCRGQMRSIACPNLQLLHIYNAFYGKLSGHDCQSPVTQLREQIPTCFSKDAPTLIREACQGQQSCDLYAEDGLYDNPCPSVTKYLFVTFTCQGKSQLGERLKMYEKQKTLSETLNPTAVSPMIERFAQQRNEMMGAPVPKSAVVCPGQTGSIYCPALKLLKITSAFYGKQQGQDCTGKIISDNTPTCYARDTVTTVKDMCDGQQSCDLFSEPELYGRTLCSATAQKYLQVNYICEGHSDLEEQLAKHKEGFMKIANYLKGPVEPEETRKFQKSPIDLVLRSTLPSLNTAKETFYDPWQDWANYNEYQQWSRTNPWAEQYQRYSPYPAMLSATTGNSPVIENRRFAQRAEARQQIAGQQDLSGSMSSYFTNPQQQQQAKRCDQCTGDCRNYLCYGCGGCPEPPPEQQMYYYPYQKQDAAYHDAFTGHVMELSGLVLSPLPKIFRRPTVRKSTKSTKSKISDDDYDDDDGDDDDDDDDDEDFDDTDTDSEVDDVNDEHVDDKKHSKARSKATKKKQNMQATFF